MQVETLVRVRCLWAAAEKHDDGRDVRGVLRAARV
jgi:hypothetical protein